MTIVQSRLTKPDGEPLTDHPVSARLVGPQKWTADLTGRVVTYAQAWTDETGLWRMDLVACPDLEWGAHMKYEIREGPFATHYARVPRSADPVWLRHIRVPEHEVTITWEPDPAELLRVHVVCAGYGSAGCRLDPGDGSPTVHVTTLDPVTITYPTPGTYPVTAVDAQDPGITGHATITVKDHPPKAHVYADSDDPWTALLWIDEPDDGTPYTVDWDDDTRPQTVCGQRTPRVPPHPRIPHDYRTPGRYRVRVTDLATKRSTAIETEIGAEIGVLLTYDQPNQLRLDAHWLAIGATWEAQADGRLPLTGIVASSGRVTVQGKPDDPGDLRLEVREVIDGAVRRRAVRRRTIPTQWDWRLGVVMTWRDPGDYPGRQTVTVNPTTARGPCTVEWGDNTPIQTVDPNTVIAHVYALPAPPAGWRLRISETGVADPRVWTRVLAEPRYVGTPVLSARQQGAVDVDVEGVDQFYNDDWYSVAWEEGGQFDPVGAVGRWYPAHHVYATPGRHVITVDGPGMPEPIIRFVDVVIYLSPIVTVAEALGDDGKVIDPTRQTVRISVDNTASGGPVWVRTGDGGDPRLCAEVDAFNHRYETAGTYYVIAASKADPTAKGRAPVTVPFAQQRTLFYTITGATGGYQVKVTITGKAPGKVVKVIWESQGEAQIVPPSNEIVHDYPMLPDPTYYDAVIFYDDDSERWPETIDIPWPGDEVTR